MPFELSFPADLFLLLPLFLLAAWAFLSRLGRWGENWGATSEEIGRPGWGDLWLGADPAARRPAGEDRRPSVRMTRAISIRAPAARVWSWIAQIGRGAGWYSYDRLDSSRVSFPPRTRGRP